MDIHSLSFDIMHNESIALLFGAGASIPSKIPGMAKMASDFHTAQKKGTIADSSYKLLTEYGATEDLEELLQLTNLIIEFPHHNLNSFVEDSLPIGNPRLIGEYRQKRNSRVKRIKSFRSQVLDWITQKCLQFDRETSLEIYSHLFKLLYKYNIPIYTTNYDGIFEYVCNQEGIPISDNFNKIESRLFWDSSLKAFNLRGIKIVRLHGSIYWHDNLKGKVEKLNPPTSLNREGERLEQMLIVPTRFKDIYSQNYFPLYSDFLRTINKARILVLVGHSLRDEYLLAAILEQVNEENLKVIIIDPQFPAEKEFKALSPESLDEWVVHLRGGIEHFIPLLNQLIDIESKPNQLFSIAQKVSQHQKKGVKEYIELRGIRKWMNRGRQSINLDVRTHVADYSLSINMIRDNDINKKINLNRCLKGKWKDSPRLIGYNEFEKKLTFSIPRDFGTGPHAIELNYLDHDNNIVNSKQYTFRLRKE